MLNLQPSTSKLKRGYSHDVEASILSRCLSGIPDLAQASFKGNWEFSRGPGALLVMAQPSSSRIPAQVLLKHLVKFPTLKDKALVTQVYNCHAYALHLSGQGEYFHASIFPNLLSYPADNVALSLALVGSMPVAPGVNAGGDLGMSWWKQHSGGLFRDACDQQGERRYTPLCILKTIRMPGLLRRDNTIIPPQGDDL